MSNKTFLYVLSNGEKMEEQLQRLREIVNRQIKVWKTTEEELDEETKRKRDEFLKEVKNFNKNNLVIKGDGFTQIIKNPTKHQRLIHSKVKDVSSLKLLMEIIRRFFK